MATFTSASNTGVTEDQVIASIVQEELIQASMLRPTVTDLSSFADKGVKAIDWPRFDASTSLGPAAQNPDGVTENAGQTVDFAVDTLNLNDWTSIPYEIPDRVSRQTRINLEAELARSAGRRYGEYMDDQIIVQLRLAADGTGSLPDHEIDLDGADAQGTASAITLDGIAKARRLLNRANVPQSDRFMVIPPEQEQVLIGLDNFRNADKYGSREALLSGEIGQIYGFRVIVHNGLNSNEACMYHRSAVAVAVQQEVKFETRRATLKLQKTEYSFALGMGQQVLDEGRRQVHMLGA
jgi:N4-gp56 family major capsid protein